jgi:hypothetical protein
MRLLKNRSTGFYLCFLLLLTMAIGGSAIVYANSSPVTATVSGGSLSKSNPTQVSLNVTKKASLVTYTLPITVIDARGTGAGWKLTITSTQFITSNGKNQLPTNASSITGVGVLCGTNSTCKKPVNSVSYPLIVPAGNSPPKPVKCFNAAINTGLGKFSLSMMVNVTIPASAPTGTYTSTIYLTVASGP